ncbi:MAG: hypothetical protein ABEJ74_01260 [Haloferacaceae archaeon]
MVWVRSEYAGELAVVFTWLSALVPWNVTYSPDIGGGSALFVRFPFVQVRYVWGVDVPQPIRTTVPVPGWLLPGVFPPDFSALVFQEGHTILLAYQVWAVGAAVLAVAVAFSVVYYLREERVEAMAVDPVRLLGVLLATAGVVLGVATYLLATRGFPEVPIPLGVLFLLGFGVVLLTAERA